MTRPYKRKLLPELERGTWTEVIYWLKKGAKHYRRRASITRSLAMIRRYRIHGEIREALAYKLEYEINLQCFLARAEGVERYDNSADNPQLSAQLRPERAQLEGDSE